MSFENIENLISDSYDHIDYVCRSELRLEILYALMRGDKTSEELNEKLNIQKTNLLRTLKELEEAKFVQKKAKKYSLTSVGNLVIRNTNQFFENFFCVSKHEEFWETHSLVNIPFRFIRNINIWKNAELVKSSGLVYNKPMNTLLRRCGSASRFRVVLPIFSLFHLEIFLDAIYENNGLMDLITSKIVYDAIVESDIADDFLKACEDGYVRVWIDYDNEINMFLTATDKFYSLSLFYMDNSYDDATMLISDDENYFKKIDNIFDCYTKKFKLLM
nr:ArsR family transcriptional regulator [uncultured Methanosphaera sp.]